MLQREQQCQNNCQSAGAAATGAQRGGGPGFPRTRRSKALIRAVSGHCWQHFPRDKGYIVMTNFVSDASFITPATWWPRGSTAHVETWQRGHGREWWWKIPTFGPIFLSIWVDQTGKLNNLAATFENLEVNGKKKFSRCFIYCSCRIKCGAETVLKSEPTPPIQSFKVHPHTAAI